MKIEIWSDFACPFCYIGKRKLEKAIEAFPHKDKIEIIYRAYELNPDAQNEAEARGAAAFSLAKGRSLEETKKMFNQITITAKGYGLEYNMEDIVMTSTKKAHRLAKWAKEHNKEPEFTELIFQAYFTHGENIANDDVLLKYVKQIGLNVIEAKKVITDNLFAEDVTSEINKGVSLGLKGVPFFVFDRKFAIAGAQPDEYFAEALEEAYEEGMLRHVGSENEHCCDDGGCDI